MSLVEHQCSKCNRINKRDEKWIDPKFFGERPPEMKSNFWCVNAECQTQLSVLLRFAKNNQINIVKELDVFPIVIREEPLVITARPRAKIS